MRKLLYILSWLPMLLIKLGLFVVGLVLIPLGFLTQRMTLVAVDEHHWPELLWLWGNDEDGLGPDWWLKKAATKGWFIRTFPRYWWLAFRNTTNNMRYLFKDYPLSTCHVETDWSLNNPMEAAWLKKAGKQSAYRWVWKKWKAGYRRVWLNDDARYSELWIGWKIGSDVPGCGFTLQPRLRRKIGE